MIKPSATGMLTWLLATGVVLVVGRTLGLSVLGNAGFVLNGYIDVALGIAVLAISLLVPAGAAILLVLNVVRRRPGVLRHLVLLVAAAVFFLAAAAVNLFAGAALPYDSMFSHTKGMYFVLCDARVPTDVVFEVAETKHLWLPFWRRAFDPSILDYSEDGSLVSNPRVRLSGDESILVIERGGQITDAIELATSTNLVQRIEWTRHDRQQAWVSRTRQVEEILRAHDVQSR